MGANNTECLAGYGACCEQLTVARTAGCYFYTECNKRYLDWTSGQVCPLDPVRRLY
jgi:adenosylmethionine-8-amino-7-oxononanoate aminotransferase